MTNDERDQALCLGIWQTDPDLFAAFWDEKNFAARGRARALCEECPVREQCLEDSLEQKEVYGLWGGIGRRERERLAKTRRDAKVKDRT